LLLKAGVEQKGSHTFFHKDEYNKYLIDFTTLNLDIYISSAKIAEGILFLDSKLDYNTDVLDKVDVSGVLSSKNALIGENPNLLRLIFVCKTNISPTSTDVQLTLFFQDKLTLKMFFTKQCNTMQTASSGYFTFLSTLFWVFLILVSLFCISVLYYYLKRNDISVEEHVYKGVDKIKRWFSTVRGGTYTSYNSYNKNNDRLPQANEDVHHRLYEESDLVDVKIKTDLKPSTSANKNTNTNYAQFTTDYGGI
jgi:hypothetical protein